MKEATDDRATVVIWSGGRDSTALLHRQLVERGTRKRRDILAISINHTLIEGVKQQIQKRCRQGFKAHMKMNGYHFKHMELSVQISDGCRHYVAGNRWQQAPIWLAMATLAAPDDSVIKFGYIRSDTFWGAKDKMQAAKDALRSINGKDLKLQYPMEGHRKYQVLEYLEKADILKYTWTCQFPTKDRKPCGRCDSCMTQKLRGYQRYLRKKRHAGQEYDVRLEEPKNEEEKCQLKQQQQPSRCC